MTGPDEVRVKVSVCAVCRTDIHIVEGDLALHKMPVIPGHQIVGRVDETGDGVTRLRVGQRIGIAWLRHVDGTCQFCRRGHENLCRDSRYTGYDADGGYAEYAVVPADFAYELPEGLDDEHVSPLLCSGLIGYRALQRAAMPEKGRLLLVGFGSSAHIVMQIALHRGHEVSVVTRGENHIRQPRELGAAWAGSDFRDLPGKANGAVLSAPSGKLVPPTLEALDRGGACSIAGIHLSDVPSLDYGRHLYQERELRSVTANTREDARAFLAEAAEAHVQPHTTAYTLADANGALHDMKPAAQISELPPLPLPRFHHYQTAAGIVPASFAHSRGSVPLELNQALQNGSRTAGRPIPGACQCLRFRQDNVKAFQGSGAGLFLQFERRTRKD